MTYGASIFLIVAGAILRYAVHLKIAGVNEHVIGLILIIAGVLGLIVATFQHFSYRRTAKRETVVRRDDSRH